MSRAHIDIEIGVVRCVYITMSKWRTKHSSDISSLWHLSLNQKAQKMLITFPPHTKNSVLNWMFAVMYGMGAEWKQTLQSSYVYNMSSVPPNHDQNAMQMLKNTEYFLASKSTWFADISSGLLLVLLFVHSNKSHSLNPWVTHTIQQRIYMLLMFLFIRLHDQLKYEPNSFRFHCTIPNTIAALNIFIYAFL